MAFDFYDSDQAKSLQCDGKTGSFADRTAAFCEQPFASFWGTRNSDESVSVAVVKPVAFFEEYFCPGNIFLNVHRKNDRLDVLVMLAVKVLSSFEFGLREEEQDAGKLSGVLRVKVRVAVRNEQSWSAHRVSFVGCFQLIMKIANLS